MKDKHRSKQFDKEHAEDFSHIDYASHCLISQEKIRNQKTEANGKSNRIQVNDRKNIKC